VCVCVTCTSFLVLFFWLPFICCQCFDCPPPVHLNANCPAGKAFPTLFLFYFAIIFILKCRSEMATPSRGQLQAPALLLSVFNCCLPPFSFLSCRFHGYFFKTFWDWPLYKCFCNGFLQSKLFRLCSSTILFPFSLFFFVGLNHLARI